MASTQNHLPIKAVQEDVVILKDGSMAVVLETSAVNFGLLSENEQLAIISAFAGLLNSLSFMIQIVIRSKRLDISSYLIKLDEARRKQTNPLLIKMIENYSAFIRNTIQENQVLDKQFYIVVPVSYLELGVGKGGDSFKKALTILLPRRDHLIRQLSRTGLKATQLDNERLIKLFYDIYNETDIPTASVSEEPVVHAPTQAQIAPVPNIPAPAPVLAPTIAPPPPPTPIAQPAPISSPVTAGPVTYKPQVNQAPSPIVSPRGNRPFVVEELPDDYGTI